MDFCVLIKHWSMECGATEIQSNHVAALATIDVLGVAQGLDPGHVMAGSAPEDLGFTVPVRLPATCVRRI